MSSNSEGSTVVLLVPSGNTSSPLKGWYMRRISPVPVVLHTWWGPNDQCSSTCCAEGASDAVLQIDLPIGCYDVILSGLTSTDRGDYDLQVGCPPSPPALPPGVGEYCSGEIDLILVIDNSGSIVEVCLHSSVCTWHAFAGPPASPLRPRPRRSGTR